MEEEKREELSSSVVLQVQEVTVTDNLPLVLVVSPHLRAMFKCPAGWGLKAENEVVCAMPTTAAPADPVSLSVERQVLGLLLCCAYP